MEVKPRIIAPICAVNDARQVIDAGADEVYCGALFDDWAATFGDSDLISRRQARHAHLRRPEALVSLAQVAAEANVAAALTLNARYSSAQMPAILELARGWENAGGSAVVVSDIGILLALSRRKSRLQRHLSLLAGTFNSQSAAFFRELGVSRIVLPRELRIEEIAELVSRAPVMEYEALVMYQKCQFIDGQCLFYHGLRLPEDAPSLFDYERLPGHAIPVTWALDPDYEGHGCQLECRTPRGPVRHLRRDDWHTPHCAACWLKVLFRAGVRHFKIAGRGYPVEMIAKAVRFVQQVISAQPDSIPSRAERQAIRRRYEETFGRPCNDHCCYYTAGEMT